jgi:RNA polymerase sigma-70 factor (ECF subfamily)
MLSDLADADDAAQETFVRLWRARLCDGDSRRLTAWIYRTSTRIALDRLRKRSARMSMDEALDRLAFVAAGPDEAHDVRRALELASSALPAAEVEIAVLHRLDGLTQAEIAEVAEMSARTVRRFLAGDALRLKISPHGFGRVAVASLEGDTITELYAAPVNARGESVLPPSWTLDSASGPEVLLLVFSQTPLSEEGLRRAAAGLPRTSEVWATRLSLTKSGGDR